MSDKSSAGDLGVSARVNVLQKARDFEPEKCRIHSRGP